MAKPTVVSTNNVFQTLIKNLQEPIHAAAEYETENKRKALIAAVRTTQDGGKLITRLQLPFVEFKNQFEFTAEGIKKIILEAYSREGYEEKSIVISHVILSVLKNEAINRAYDSFSAIVQYNDSIVVVEAKREENHNILSVCVDEMVYNGQQLITKHFAELTKPVTPDVPMVTFIGGSNGEGDYYGRSRFNEQSSKRPLVAYKFRNTDAAYPMISGGLHNMYKTLNDPNTSPLIIVFGDSGTGKTSLVYDYAAFTKCQDITVVPSGEDVTINFLRNWSQKTSTGRRILLLEDVAKLLIGDARVATKLKMFGEESIKKDGSDRYRPPVLTELLTIVEELAKSANGNGNNHQIIINTNLNPQEIGNHISEALGREGRTGAYVFTRRYTTDEAVKLATELKIPADLIAQIAAQPNLTHSKATIYGLKRRQSTTNKGLERNIFGITPDEFQTMMPQFYSKLTGPFIAAEDPTNPPF